MWADDRRAGVFVDEAGRLMWKRSHVTVSSATLLCADSGLRISRIALGYPHEVPQGTAIPKWAFLNVMACHTSTFLPTKSRGLMRRTPILRVCRTKLPTKSRLLPSVVSLASHFTFDAFLRESVARKSGSYT